MVCAKFTQRGKSFVVQTIAMIASLTRNVLAHRRRYIIGWVLITVVGVALSGTATKAMDQKFSAPGKEGWDTNVAIAKTYGGTGGNAAPLGQPALLQPVEHRHERRAVHVRPVGELLLREPGAAGQHDHDPEVPRMDAVGLEHGHEPLARARAEPVEQEARELTELRGRAIGMEHG